MPLGWLLISIKVITLLGRRNKCVVDRGSRVGNKLKLKRCHLQRVNKPHGRLLPLQAAATVQSAMSAANQQASESLYLNPRRQKVEGNTVMALLYTY